MRDRYANRRPPTGDRKGLVGRLPCPVCLGVKMEKIQVAPGLQLDACDRCGGMWFDAGEVAQLRKFRPQALWQHVEALPDDYRMKCHECAATFKRNEEKCPACGWINTLACPVCAKALTRVVQNDLAIDVCKRCRGAWFDNTELAAVWNRQVTALEQRRPGAPAGVSDDHLVLHALIWTDPTVLYLGGHLAANVASNAAPLAGAAVEATGELAGGVLEAIGDLISGIFDIF